MAVTNKPKDYEIPNMGQVIPPQQVQPPQQPTGYENNLYWQQLQKTQQAADWASQPGNAGLWGSRRELSNQNLRQAESDWNRKGIYEQMMQNQMGQVGNANYGGQIGDMGYNPSQQWNQVNQGMAQMGAMPNTAQYWQQNQGNFQFPGMGGQGPQFPQQMPGQFGPGQNVPQGNPNITPSAMNMGAAQGQGMNATGVTQRQSNTPTGNLGFQPNSQYGQAGQMGQVGNQTNYLDNYLQQGQPNLNLGITTPDVGGVPQSPDYQGAVQGGMNDIGQRSAEGQLSLADQLAQYQGALDPATRQALLAPAQQQAKQIADQQYKQLMESGNALGFNAGFNKNVAMDVAQAASTPLIQAEADIVNQGLNRQMQALGMAGEQYGAGAQREYGQNLGQKELNLGAATQAGSFALGQGTFSLNKGNLMLDAQQVRQNGVLTANGQRIQEQLGKAGLDLSKYETKEGIDLEKAKFDFTKQLETRGMNLQERMQASDEFYKGLGMSMDAQDRDFQRQQTMTEMIQNQAQWDDDMGYKYKGLQLEGMLQAAGIDSQNARWAGELAANILTGREKMDQENWMFLKQLDAQSGGSIFGQIFGGAVGGLLGSFTGGLGTAIGTGLGSSLFGGGNSGGSSGGGGNPGGYWGQTQGLY